MRPTLRLKACMFGLCFREGCWGLGIKGCGSSMPGFLEVEKLNSAQVRFQKKISKILSHMPRTISQLITKKLHLRT